MDNTQQNHQFNELLSSLTSFGSERKIPPLDEWLPSTITPFNIIIQDNGDWYHNGTKITRQSLVDLFASVLWADMDKGQKRHFLKTPTDKYEITVIDTPLFINHVDKIIQNNDEWIVFSTTHGDTIILDDNPVYFKEFTQENMSEYRPYIDTRFNLSARINRNAFYHLVALGELIDDNGQAVLVVQSGGKTHRIFYPL